jgi:hypothetical protein
MTHARTADKPGSMGTTAATCSCGWESAPTNRPQHVQRAYTSHRRAAMNAKTSR